MALPSWMYAADKCDCFGGFCLRRFHCSEAKKKSVPRKSKPRKRFIKKIEDDNTTYYNYYSAKPDDLRPNERVWRAKE